MIDIGIPIWKNLISFKFSSTQKHLSAMGKICWNVQYMGAFYTGLIFWVVWINQTTSFFIRAYCMKSLKYFMTRINIYRVSQKNFIWSWWIFFMDYHSEFFAKVIDFPFYAFFIGMLNPNQANPYHSLSNPLSRNFLMTTMVDVTKFVNHFPNQVNIILNSISE